MFCFVYPPSAFAEEKPVGKIIGISGTAEFRSEPGAAPVAKGAAAGAVQPAAFEPWSNVKFQQPVYAKDVFRTLPQSRLKILFEDNSLIALGPNSEMKVESYLYKPEDKLRQGVINVAHGLSMYIVNKAQKNENSSFRVVSPTANIAARGTHGYLSVSPTLTLVANQAGTVATQNANPSIKGAQDVGPMMKNAVPQGAPPTPPVPLTKEELSAIRSVIVAPVGLSSSQRGKDALIRVEEEKKEKKEEKKEKEKEAVEKTKEGQVKEKEGKEKEKEGKEKAKEGAEKAKEGAEKTREGAEKAKTGAEKAEKGGPPPGMAGGPGERGGPSGDFGGPAGKGGPGGAPPVEFGGPPGAGGPSGTFTGPPSEFGKPGAFAPPAEFGAPGAFGAPGGGGSFGAPSGFGAPGAGGPSFNFIETFAPPSAFAGPRGPDFAAFNQPFTVTAQFGCR